MMTLFDDEYIYKTHIESERREAAREATREATEKAARKMHARGDSIEEIADILDIPAETVEQWLKTDRA